MSERVCKIGKREIGDPFPYPASKPAAALPVRDKEWNQISKAWSELADCRKSVCIMEQREKQVATAPVLPEMSWEYKHMLDLRNAICATIPEGESIGDAELVARPAKLLGQIATLTESLRVAEESLTRERAMHEQTMRISAEYHTQRDDAEAELSEMRGVVKELATLCARTSGESFLAGKFHAEAVRLLALPAVLRVLEESK